MIEAQLRAKAPSLQKVYDRMPHPVQDLLTSARGWFLIRNRYTPDMYDSLNELRTHENWTSEQIVAYQTQSLQKIVDHARASVPFYAGYPPIDLTCPEDISRYPVLSRETVRENADRFVSRGCQSGQGIRVGTTGTTGANLNVAYSQAVARRNWAFWMRQWLWAGVEPRQPRITLYGSRVVPPGRTRPPYWTHNVLERQILISIFHLAAHAAPSYLDCLGEHHGQILEGFPSALGIVADFVLEQGAPIPMRVVFSSGEPLYPFLREKIERAFQARVYDSYLMTEWCGMIQECEQGQMHLAPDYAYLEILDEQDQPVSPGREGYLVWTGFINDAMPLIRYRIGDRGCWLGQRRCSCGRAFPLVVPTITRESDLLRSPDGRIFSPRALNQTLKRASSFRFCQLVQYQPGRVMVRAVPSNRKALSDLAIVRENLQNVLGPGMQVAAELAEEPIVRAGGKIPLIVQQLH